MLPPQVGQYPPFTFPVHQESRSGCCNLTPAKITVFALAAIMMFSTIVAPTFEAALVTVLVIGVVAFTAYSIFSSRVSHLPPIPPYWSPSTYRVASAPYQTVDRGLPSTSLPGAPSTHSSLTFAPFNGEVLPNNKAAPKRVEVGSDRRSGQSLPGQPTNYS